MLLAAMSRAPCTIIRGQWRYSNIEAKHGSDVGYVVQWSPWSLGLVTSRGLHCSWVRTLEGPPPLPPPSPFPLPPAKTPFPLV